MKTHPSRRDYHPAPEDGTLKPISGLAALSSTTRDLLVRTGRALEGLSEVELPVPYLIASERDALTLGDDTDEEAAIDALLPHISRLSKQGITRLQIAHRLSLPGGSLREGEIFIPAIAAAIAGGLAVGVDEVTKSVESRAASGDVRSAKLFLEARADGWQAKPQAPVVVNVGKDLAAVSLDDFTLLRDNQSKLLEDVDYTELGG